MINNNSNDMCGYSDVDWAGSFDRKLIIHIHRREFSHMKKQEIKYYGSVKRRSKILSHDIYRE
jgi:hypothetical protein